MANKCFVRCCSKRHPDILLPNNESLMLGRGPQTKIKEKRCSREQVQLWANYSKFIVQLKQIGPNPAVVNGKEFVKGDIGELEHEETVELLPGEFKYKIIFDPKPPKDKSSPLRDPIKRKMTTEVKTPLKVSKTQSSLFDVDYDITALEGSHGFRWEKVQNGDIYVMTSESCAGKSKIAAFDMDGTIITTQSGRVFAKDVNDWRILYPEVPGKLKSLHLDGYKIVIITNQRGIAIGRVKLDDFKVKVQRIAQKLNVPLQLFCCSGDGGMFRKPRIGVWNLLKARMNDNISINQESSFYCGDAAGRLASWMSGKKKDFSCSDRLFALNLEVAFHTPEEFFLGQKPTKKYNLPEFDPKSVDPKAPLLEPKSTELTSETQEVILLVGVQGSGKSFLAETIYEPAGYVVASNDRSGGRDKTLKILAQALDAGQSVVVDNTHGERDTRQKFVEVAQKRGVPVRCFLMKASAQQARHNNLFRELIGSDHAMIKEPLFHAFKARYQEPDLNEGFSAIAKVNFVPKFRNPEEERLYRMYLQEK
ncbi:hypothetical protein TCAL_05698, partial [Tigriopus californicus]|eukprot:TCALIF_05698-PA protein Name:"Similar to PNKP Bifunctional polynucleotide phosphatase/kinase (Homo sapiens)" AED:0.05 eAED:0.05 QI:125/0.75/0.6/1/0.5/0.4/5/0/534